MSCSALAPKLNVPSLVTRFQTGSLELIDSISEQWRALCMEGPCNEPFYRPECLRAYLQAFEPASELVLLSAWREDELRGVLPLLSEKRRQFGCSVKVLRAPVNVHSCRFDLICGLADGEQVASQFWKVIEQELEWDLLVANFIPADSQFGLLLKKANDKKFLSISKVVPAMPSIDLGTYTSKQKQPYESLRKRLPNKLKKLKALGNVSLERNLDASPEQLEKFYALEGAGWKGREGSAIKCNNSTREFYELLAKAAAEYKFLSIYSLELDGKPVAMHYGLTLDGVYYAPKVAYDEAFKAFSPGQLLVMLVLDECKSQGLRRYELLGEISDWKRVWANEMLEHQSHMIFSKQMRGDLVYLKECMLQRLRRLKRAVNRLTVSPRSILIRAD